MIDGELEIYSTYPGGNITNVVEEGGTITLEQNLRDTIDWWFYWNFGVESETAQAVTFEFTNGEVVGPWGPAISHDRHSWSWLGAESANGHDEFTYTFEAGERVYFAYSLPYVLEQFEEFVSEYDRCEATSLTTSEKGRAVPLLELGDQSASEAVVLTCRSHACESTASYVLEGILRELLDGETDVLDRYGVHVVPFVDLDGVQRGDQGKARFPHDHNRDYVPNGNGLSDDIEPIYRSTAAIIDHVQTMDAELVAGFDFHCPFMWDSDDDADEGTHTSNEPFFIRPEGSAGKRVESFSETLAARTRRESGGTTITHDSANDLHVADLEWLYATSPSATNFFHAEGAQLAATCEFPYFGTEQGRVTSTSSRQFGRQFARALHDELATSS